MPSLTTLRRHFLREKLRGYRLATTGAWDGSAYVGTVPGSNADQKRIVVSYDWADQAVDGGLESDLPPGWLDNAFVYLPGTGEQRRIPKLGFTGAELASTITDQASLTSTYVGYVTVSQPFAATVAANQAVEISTRLPIKDTMLLAGVHTILNRALRRMYMPSRLALVGITGQDRYSLAAYASWIKRQDQLIRVLAPETTVGVEPLPLTGAHSLRLDNQTPYLLLGNDVPTGDVFWVDLWRPRSSWINVGGSWAESPAGLVNESDEANVDADELAIVAYYFACDELAEHGPDGTRAQWAERREKAAMSAFALMRWERERYDDPTDNVPHRRSDTIGGSYQRSYHGGTSSWP